MVEDGARVVLTDRDAEGLERLAGELGDAVATHTGDIRSEATVATTIELAEKCFGRLDVIHNNAAVAADGDTDTVGTPDEVWRGTFELVVMAAVWSCRHGIPALRRTGAGSIVNMSTGAAQSGMASRGAYATSKGALESLTLQIATQYGPEGIRCNAVAPGFVLTETVRGFFDEAAIARFGDSAAAGRVCVPEDVADVVAFLASDDARYVSGQIVRVNGGGSRAVAW